MGFFQHRAALNEVARKIDSLEEKLINNQVEFVTYKKWFSKLNGERGNLDREIVELKKDKQNIFDRLEEAVPEMCNLNKLYLAAPLEAKQMLLNKVFEVGIMYDGKSFRTPMIHPALISNYLRIREKGLVKVDQPYDVLLKLEACTLFNH